MIRKLKYTGIRINKYLEAVNKYGNNKKALNKRKEELNELEIKARTKTIVKDKKIDVLIDITLKKVKDNSDYIEKVVLPISQACNQLKNDEYFYIQFSTNSQLVKNEVIKARGGDGTAIFWNNINKLFLEEEASTSTNILIDNNKHRIVITKNNKILPKKIQQTFRDGVQHCVLQPLQDYYLNISKNSESDSSKKRYLQLANKLKKLEAIYPTGVPEDKMDEIGNIANRCLVIHDIIGNEIKKFNDKSSQYFHFTNTRINHLDKGFLTVDKLYTYVSQPEMDIIFRDHEKNNEFCLVRKDFQTKKCNALKSIKGDWFVKNDDYDLYKEFNDKIGINDYYIDSVKHPELNKFILDSRIINSTPVKLCEEPNSLEDVKHIDIEKAYTQHDKCNYFMGFMGHVQKFNKLPFDIDSIKFLKDHLGIFHFSVIENKNVLLKKLGIKENEKYTLPSPEILYFIQEFGLKIKLLAGCWGSKFNFEYTPEILEKRKYCTWAGKLSIDNDKNSYSFNCNDNEWVSNLKQELGNENVSYFKDMELVIIHIDKKSNKTKHHILSFITSYTRINMLNIMKNIKGELVKVVLDGIYYRGELGKIDVPYKEKEVREHIGIKDGWYSPISFDTISLSPYNEKLDGNCVLSGQGGSGKSYSVLTDKGIIDPLYIVPCHVLGRKCRTNYGCNYTTIHKLIGEGCQPYKDEYKVPSVIFIDEVTMIEKEWIDKAIQMYPNSLIYIAGDIDGKQWYQCRNGYSGNFSKIWLGDKWRFVHYENDFRSKDEELKEMKLKVRAQMKKIFTDGNQLDAMRMNIFATKNFKTIKFANAIKMFQTGDVWIAGTHKTNQLLLKNNIVSGYINKNKEIVQKDEKGSEKRGSFTTHSLQGLTLENERIFISLDFFEYAMFYTSISRACNFKQIVIVDN